MDQTKAVEQIDRYIRARYPIIALVSHEEARVMTTIKAIASNRDMKVATWTVTRGMQGLNGIDSEGTRDPIAAFETILSMNRDGDPILFVMKDIHKFIQNDPVNIRYMRDVADRLETSKHTLILLSPEFTVPPDLEKTIAILDFPLPGKDEIEDILQKCERDLPSHIPVTLNGNRDKVVQALRGLTAFEAASVLLSGVVATRELGEGVIPFIVKEKAQIIRKAGVLEFYDTSVTMNEVGGLDNLKRYAAVKRNAFSTEAKNAGVDAPKGVLMVGIPGTGKSLAAKAMAGGKMPLLRMDIGSLMGGLVGQSEGNMRSALKVAEAVAPCVLWVDEIEKALGGVGTENDGGTSKRVFGTLLTWMQETEAPVYVVATANDVRSMRPELLRRFDDIFWVDLPDAESRLEILKVHLKKRGQKIEAFPENECDQIVTEMWGYTGAEIEKVVKSAIETAFFEGKPLSSSHLLSAARVTIPICKTMQQEIDDLKKWANGRALPAGKPLEAQRQELVTSRKADI